MLLVRHKRLTIPRHFNQSTHVMYQLVKLHHLQDQETQDRKEQVPQLPYDRVLHSQAIPNVVHLNLFSILSIDPTTYLGMLWISPKGLQKITSQPNSPILIIKHSKGFRKPKSYGSRTSIHILESLHVLLQFTQQHFVPYYKHTFDVHKLMKPLDFLVMYQLMMCLMMHPYLRLCS